MTEVFDRLSVYHINKDNIFPFNPEDYSRFKFGDKDISRKFGFLLAAKFLKYLSDYPITQQMVVVSSPYNFIPTATFAMKNYFVQKVNQYLVEKRLPVLEETKIHRTNTYNKDYGKLDAEERMKLIGKDSFHIDAKFLEGKVALYMDDIRITGSHEKVVKRMINTYNLTNPSIFLYLAELTNNNIHPSIEDRLNYAYVEDLIGVNKLIRDYNFIPNTRVVKYMLAYNRLDFKKFADYQSLKFLLTIYHLAIGNSYHLHEEYSWNLSYIQNLLIKNELL